MRPILITLILAGCETAAPAMTANMANDVADDAPHADAQTGEFPKGIADLDGLQDFCQHCYADMAAMPCVTWTCDPADGCAGHNRKPKPDGTLCTSETTGKQSTCKAGFCL